MAMLNFLMKFDYSNASWARMLAVTDDRTSAVVALLEAQPAADDVQRGVLVDERVAATQPEWLPEWLPRRSKIISQPSIAW
jgi:hypothetical protein